MARTANQRQQIGNTLEGGPTYVTLDKYQELRRAVLTCLLWENEFYRSGNETADRIRKLAAELPFDQVAELARDARTKYKLRHVPLWLVVAILDSGAKGDRVSQLIADVIQRPDEMTELVSLYWKNGKKPLARQLKKGLAKAFVKFNEYSLAKFDKKGVIRVRDIMALCRPKPQSAEQEALFRRIADRQMVTPDTWETNLSAGADKAQTFTRLIDERKLGPQALLKNLRNMVNFGVDYATIRKGLGNVKTERVLPFEFISAARHAPQFEPELEELMFRCLGDDKFLKGTTTLLLDKSGSMNSLLSSKSELTRFDAAVGLAMLLREVCEHVNVVLFNDKTYNVKPRRGFALRDELHKTAQWGGTMLGHAIRSAPKADRLIVLTDEASFDHVGGPPSKNSYMINVATYEHTVGYGEWVRVAGWSEAIVDFIREIEVQSASR